MIIQVNYDLNKPGQAYADLIARIKSTGISWAKPCESCWLIATRKSPKEVYDELRPFMDANDLLLVSRFYSNDYVGWIKKEVHEWIKNHQSTLRDLTF